LSKRIAQFYRSKCVPESIIYPPIELSNTTNNLDSDVYVSIPADEAVNVIPQLTREI